MDRLAEGKRIFDIEIEALKKTRDALDDTYIQILDLITNCNGKVIITGMGKPGHIAAKLAATFASLGTPAFRLHPAEAMHGDLGMVSANDVVIAISFSGESDEIVRILPNIKMIGAKLVGLTGNPNSTLAQVADVVQILPKFEEACYLGLAPTSSTTAALCYGDSLAVVASGIYGFKDSDFGKFHPAGSLGKKLLLRVSDLMVKDDDVCIVSSGSLLQNILPIMGKSSGMVCIADNMILKGVFTDGDIRRLISNHKDIYSSIIDSIMTKNPITIDSSALAVDALHLMHNHNITALPALKSNILKGVIYLKDITKCGIVAHNGV